MFRKITKEDEQLFHELVLAFYQSPAVIHPLSEEIVSNTFHELMRSDELLEGFIFEVDNEPAGYALFSKSFSPEVGGKSIFIEEIYILPQFQGRGLGSQFLQWVKSTYKDVKRLRLEISQSNQKAMQLYEKLGYEVLDYIQMVQDFT